MRTNHLLTVFVALSLLTLGCGKEKKKSKQASEATTESAASQPEASAETEKKHAAHPAKSASGDNAVAAAKPAPAAKPAVVKAKSPSPPARKVPGSLNIMDSPRKGPAVAKVTIMEISDFQ